MTRFERLCRASPKSRLLSHPSKDHDLRDDFEDLGKRTTIKSAHIQLDLRSLRGRLAKGTFKPIRSCTSLPTKSSSIACSFDSEEARGCSLPLHSTIISSEGRHADIDSNFFFWPLLPPQAHNFGKEQLHPLHNGLTFSKLLILASVIGVEAME